MASWVIWILAASVLIVAELFTMTLYLLMVAIGLAVGSLVALLGWSIHWQLAVAAIVALVATYLLRRSKIGRRSSVNSAHDPNVNLDIGQKITIEQWLQDEGSKQYTARVKYRGALWDVELAPTADAHAGLFVIQEIRGSRLIVANSRN